MKAIVCVCLLGLVAVAFARPDEDQYTDKFDNVNIDEILESDRLLEGYFKCIMDEGPCTADGKELKSHIKEALENHCAKCNDKHKEGTKKVIKFLINKKAEMWDKLKTKYDPDGEYTKKYENELKEVQA